MPCYHPLTAWRGEYNPSGKRKMVFSKSEAKDAGLDIKLPCGQCIGCRLERSRQWALRCLHESRLYQDNCFLTLTYDDSHLPADQALHKEHFQLFMKRLRKKFPLFKVRYLMCGEYGENSARPHYHACLFNFDFPDKVLWSEKQGTRLYVSEILNKVWGHGYCIIGDVTFQSAQYIANYILKKKSRQDSKMMEIISIMRYISYEYLEEQVEKHFRDDKAEYITMSRGGRDPKGKNLGGIGRQWYEKFKDDVYPSDFLVVNGQKVHPPKYYDSVYELEMPDDYKLLKEKRKSKLSYINSYAARLSGRNSDTENGTPGRLAIKEFIKKEKLKDFVRDF